MFGKRGLSTISAAEALEEALCFGWIDGQLQSVDDTKYKKYFARRRPDSVWSEKNKKLVAELAEKGLMQESGLSAVETAKKNGSWNNTGKIELTADDIELLTGLLRPHEPAYTNFTAMPPLVKRTYALMYKDAKTEETRAKRLNKIIDRLNQNLKPM